MEPKSPSAIWTESAKQIEPWLPDQRLSESYLRFRIKLATAYAQAQEALAAASAPAPGAGRLTAAEVNFDADILARLFQAVVVEQVKEPGPAMAQIIERVAANPALLARLAQLSVFEPEGEELKALAGAMGVGEIELLLLGRMLAVPAVIDAARRRPPVEPEAPDANTCPVCGSAPLLARLRVEDGKRRLVCSLCLTDWSYPRMTCPSCQKPNNEALEMISLPESEGRWIEICRKCGRYIKTFDQRKLPAGPFLPFVEDSITLPLDLLAEREGFRR